MSIYDFTVYSMFKRNASLFNNKPALIFDNKVITFGELFSQIQSLSGGLSNQGIHKTDRIAVLSQNNHKFFQLNGAAAAIGAIIVPINWRLSGEEIQNILLDSAPTTIFFDEIYLDMISLLRPKCKSLKKFFVFGNPVGDFGSFDGLMNNYPTKEVEVKGNDPCMLIYTAAVHGKPMGAILNHDNAILCNIQTIGMMGLTYRDTYLNILPLFHVAGFALAFSVMHTGGRNVFIHGFEPKVVLEKIEKERVTIIGSFPPILTQLLAEISKRVYDLSTLKHVLGLDSVDTIAEFERKTGCQFWLPYGQTETMGLTCICSNSERPGSAGRPGSLVDLKIVDEFDCEVEVGKPGEILIRGPLVFKGYWGEEELTKYTFREGWHHTGDIGRLDEEGFLFFVGRKAEKELIKSGGENVYPVEVEKVVFQHPSIQEVTVIGVPDPKFGEGIKAVCVLRPNTKLSEQELIDFVAGRIGRYKKPRYISFVDSLPKKEDGSVDRKKVKALYGDN